MVQEMLKYNVIYYMLMPNIAVNIYYIICYLNTNFNVIENYLY